MQVAIPVKRVRFHGMITSLVVVRRSLSDGAHGVVVMNRIAWLATKEPHFSQTTREMGHPDCYDDGEVGHPPTESPWLLIFGISYLDSGQRTAHHPSKESLNLCATCRE